ncbi:hypothetical protein D049_2441 [Vibrio parahaemolyticus VPTS-2010]|nr:hypothetical protein VPUCM_1726 [Vibrio parahaemolyticus UCM-V493]EXJ43943.1 hypothetical protein D049_2441 [Vibrio parahaemolyticus VPTS-2010]
MENFLRCIRSSNVCDEKSSFFCQERVKTEEGGDKPIKASNDFDWLSR